MARIRGAASQVRVEAFPTTWELAEVALGDAAPTSPSELDGFRLRWIPADVPGTVAGALRAAGEWKLGDERDFDAHDFWYRVRFASSAAGDGESVWLCVGGLATIAEVWLNGERVLASDNMFHEHALDVTALVRAENELCIRFASLATALAKKRPRPRYRTRLVEHQQLRWQRTTLLGRIPAWCPRVPAVGPFRAVRLERRRGPWPEDVSIVTRLESDRATVEARVQLARGASTVRRAELTVAGRTVELTLTDAKGTQAAAGTLALDRVERWWPHTHGASARYPARLRLEGAAESFDFELGPLAFRTIEAHTEDDGFRLLVNGVEVFCRGACWTTDDIVTLGAGVDPALAIERARAAGMNMLRVGGTMLYESDAFYEACDRAGILVWQDYMFANLDYPADDAAFASSVRREVEQFLSRTQTSACIAVLCGNSEVEQQASMLGLPADAWKQRLFTEQLAEQSAGLRGDVPYLSSTPTGGELPFSVSSGIAHYYGVGAYLRPLEDARRSGVRFTSECLGFANIPEDPTLELFLEDGESAFHHPRWKARVPRDRGSGWDFDDVRDHYTRELFGVDPLRLRYADPERALRLGRATSGEVMAAVIAEWRRQGSSCRGALIWFFKDLWPGAGWGLLDSTGSPKAAYFYVKRAMQPIALFLSDEGLNGLALQLVNDTPAALRVDVSLRLLKGDGTVVAEGVEAGLDLRAQSARALGAARLFGRFLDTTYAYRFGPRGHDVAMATMTDATTGACLGRWFHFPERSLVGNGDDFEIEAVAVQREPGVYSLTLGASRFAQAIAIDVRGFEPDDAYFHLPPGETREVLLRSGDPAKKPSGAVQALNQQKPSRIVVRAPAREAKLS